MNYYFISEKGHACVKTYLRSKGQLVELSNNLDVDTSIATHPDVWLVNIKGQLIVAPNICEGLLSILKDSELAYVLGNHQPHSPYPGHIPYNVVVLDRYLLHNLDVTEPKLLEAARVGGLTPIHVRQGYTKCSTVVVDGRSIITSDLGISKSISALDIECLVVQEGFVSLDPFPYGFLGGASGRVEDALVWNGSLEHHPDREAIRAFVKSKGLKNIEFEGMPLIDIGTIIEWKVN